MKQEIKTEITIEKILVSAENEFAAKGMFGARIDTIAENAKVNKRMIYQHFKSKEGLYSAVLLRVYSRLAEKETGIFAKEMSASEAIESIVREYFMFLKKDENFVRIIMWENLNNAEYLMGAQAVGVKIPFINAVRKILKKVLDN